jgi:hypothetical protein
MKTLSRAKQGQIEPKAPALGSGRLQSEMSSKTKGGLRPARNYFENFHNFI